MTKVFVYGSLRKGHGNHGLLHSAKFLRQDITSPEFTMYDLGAFPAVTTEGGTAIHGELYEVDDETFQRLDILEGYPDFYDRMLLSFGEDRAWMYFIDDMGRGNIVETGNWNDRRIPQLG